MLGSVLSDRKDLVLEINHCCVLSDRKDLVYSESCPLCCLTEKTW